MSLTPAEILARLPHRSPSRFVDEILEVGPGHIVTRYAWREEDCAGHFPGNPVVPGVKLLEMAAQSAACWGLSRPETPNGGHTASFGVAEHILFKKMVRPGDVALCRVSIGGGTGGRLMAAVEILFFGGPKDGEPILAGCIQKQWASSPENAK